MRAEISTDTMLRADDLFVSSTKSNTLIVSFYFLNSYGKQNLKSELLRSVGRYFEDKNLNLTTSEIDPSLKYIERVEGFEHFFLLHHQQLLGATDTEVVELGVSSSLTLSENAWHNLTIFFRELLSQWKDFFALNEKKNLNFIGFSQIYKCNARDGQAKIKIDQSLLNQMQSVFSSTVQQFYNLERVISSSGSIFLTQVPRGPGLNSHLIYAVATDASGHDDFFRYHFYSNSYQYLTTDAYVHKAAYQYWQIKEPSFTDLNEKLTTLSKESVSLFHAVGKAHLSLDSRPIDNVADRLTTIVPYFVNYKDLEISIHKQHENLEIKTQNDQLFFSQPNGILNYHLNTIKRQLDDCQITLQRWEMIIDHVNTAIQLLDAQQSKAINYKLSRSQIYWGIIGASLAFVQVFDNEVTEGFLKLFHVYEVNYQNLFWLIVFGTKLMVGLILLIIVLMINRLFRKRA